MDFRPSGPYSEMLLWGRDVVPRAGRSAHFNHGVLGLPVRVRTQTGALAVRYFRIGACWHLNFAPPSELPYQVVQRVCRTVLSSSPIK